MAPTSETAFHAKDRKAWRKWLQKNHASKEFIWLIIYRKQSAIPSVYYDEAVEEALCFGWIDSKPNKRDEESFYLYFAKRNPKSKWSKLNKERVSRLIKEKQMTEAGMAMIDLAKTTGTWTALESSDNLEIPVDLKKEFSKNKAAFKYFKAFPPSAKKGILQWINDAKREDTRIKRIQETVSLAAKNVRANQYTPKK